MISGIRAKLLMVVLSSAAMSACSEAGSLTGGASKSSSESTTSGDTTETSAKPPGEAKPSEEGEGVPGYLVDPDGLDFAHDQSSQLVTLTAASQAIIAADGSDSPVHVSAWQVTASELDNFKANGKAHLSATLLGSGQTEAGGSLAFAFRWNGEGELLFSTMLQPQEDLVTVAPGAEGRHDTLVLVDETGSGHFIDIGTLASGSIDDAQSDGKDIEKGDDDQEEEGSDDD